jgi:peptide-methionine (S)-S-oxide reductase
MNLQGGWRRILNGAPPHRVSEIMMKPILSLLVAGGIVATAAWYVTGQEDQPMQVEPKKPKPENTECASFGGGCFWCVEAVFQRQDGVFGVVSGYQGGKTENPTYQEICGGDTGHAEVVRIEFDPKSVSYPDLVELFFKAHDPTTLNRQGADAGTQYRSAIFTYGDEQKKVAEAVKKALDESGAFKKPIVTEIAEAPTFYAGEEYHQNYYNQNKSKGYCVFNITPKLKKLGME